MDSILVGRGQGEGQFSDESPGSDTPSSLLPDHHQGTAGMSYLSLEDRYHLGIHTSKGTPVRE